MNTNRISMAATMIAGAMAIHGLTAACGPGAAHAGPGGGPPSGTEAYSATCDPKTDTATVKIPNLLAEEIVVKAHVIVSPTTDIPPYFAAKFLVLPFYGVADGLIVVSCSGGDFASVTAFVEQ